MKLIGTFGAAIAELPLRPLLFTGVTAASAGIFCYLLKRGDGKKPTADPQDKTPPEAVCDQATELFLLQPKEVPQYQERKQERESHSLLQAEIKELKISLAEAEEKHQNAVESITQLEVEKSALQDKIVTLQKTVQEMGNLLIESNKECDNLQNERERELETQNLLKIKCKEMEESLAHKEELLKVSLAEAEEKHQNAVESITQLEVEKSALQDQIETLQKAVQEMGNLLIESNKECDNLQNERERELETQNLLKIKCKEMEESLAHKEELLKVSLAEAEEKHQNAVESITQLEVEKSALQDQIETLQKTVQEMGNLLIESNKECDNLQNERERELETHNLLKIKCKEMEESLAHKEELLKEHEQMMETHNILQATNKDIAENLQHCEELLMEHKQEGLSHSFLQDQNDILMVSLAEAEEKYQNAVESITQLEVEKSALQDKIETLEKTVQDMGNLCFESNKECDNLTNVSLAEAEEKYQNAVESITQLEVKKSALQDKIETLEKTVQEMGNLCFESNKECDNLTKISLAEAEEKHQNAVESITQLGVEKSALQDKIVTLQKTVQEMGNLLIESNKECDNLKNERERELETHNLLKIKCKEMEESLAHKEELLKEHEQMMETHNILQATNKDIAENLQHCEELLMEHKQEGLSHSFLQDQNDILTICLAEAEGKHRNAVESITWLDDEKSALQDQIETLETGNLRFESNKECDNLANVSLINLKENHQKPKETIAYLKEESTDITDEIDNLTIGILNMNLKC